MITEIETDNVTKRDRFNKLTVQEVYLSSVLVDKDKIILDEEKHIK